MSIPCWHEGMEMKGTRLKCTRCGNLIVKSSFINPYLCRWCQLETDFSDTYSYLDSPKKLRA
ncbi:hypothetical protein HYY72_04570 [Candidatus Woesearchaeota archaeon]|nr:hypothetical protein [Candidatus Woesearchaeota archaeon]